MTPRNQAGIIRRTVRTPDPTEQSWTIQPPAVAAYDPATGFPWPIGDDPFLRPVLVYDVTEQAWSVSLLPFVGTDDPGDPAALSVGGDDTAQAWPVVAPPFVPAGGDDVALFPLAFDDTTQSWTIQPPVVVVFDPATGFPWNPPADDASTPSGYDVTEQAWSVQVIAAAPAFDPATGFPWNEPGPDVIAQPVWTVDDGAVIRVAPFIGNEPGSDPQARTWFDATDQSYAIQPPVLDVASLAGLWTSADPTQDRSLQPVWYDPSDSGATWTATLPSVTTVTGGRGPDAATAESSVPVGLAVAPKPGGSASGPLPSGSATNPTPRR